MKTKYNYTCPRCNIHDKIKLLFAKRGEFQNQYFYTCYTQDCKFYLNSHLNTKHDLSNLNHHEIGWECDNLNQLMIVGSSLNCEDCINAIKISMLDKLSHFVECTWGWHYNNLFDRMIKPYFDNLDMLKFFLRSTDTIRDEYNNANGYKMYGHLYDYLCQVDSRRIRDFVQSEFNYPYA